MLAPNIMVLWEKKSGGKICDFVKFSEGIKSTKQAIIK